MVNPVERPWKYVEELCALYDIRDSAASEDFVGLCDIAAYYKRHNITDNLQSIVTEICREKKMSKVVYWSRLKRTVRPILDADVSTLRALGLPVSEPVTSVPVLVAAIVEVIYKDKMYEKDIL